MLKTLIKKEFAGFFGAMFRGRKFAKSNQAITLIGFVVLFAVMFVSLCAVFAGVSYALIEKLRDTDNLWFYGAYTMLFATVSSLIGSIFATQTQLYGAKDNDLLLSLPIPASYILISRMIPLYVCNLFFVAAVTVPALFVYALVIGLNALSLTFWILDIVAVSFLSLAICCLIGRLTAKITQKYKSNPTVTIIVSFVFLGLYILIVSRMQQLTEALINGSDALSWVFKNYLPSVYWTGLSTTGNALAFIGSFLLNVAVCALCFALLSKTYVSIVTENKSFAVKLYKVKTVKTKTAFGATLYKEFLRFKGTPVYFVNCCFGVVLLIIATVAIIVKADFILDAIKSSGFDKDLLLFCFIFVACAISAQDCVSACSISLEGKSLWIIKSLPISSSTLLRAKLALHTLVTAPFAVIFLATCGIVFDYDVVTILFSCLIAVEFVFITGAFGLKRNLKNCDLDWTNEARPVKQSVVVLLCMTAGFFFAALTALTAFTLSLAMPAYFAALTVAVILFTFSALYLKWFDRKGVELFENL